MRKETCCRQFCSFKVVRQMIFVYQYTLGIFDLMGYSEYEWIHVKCLLEQCLEN